MGWSICDFAVFFTLHLMIATWARMTLYDHCFFFFFYFLISILHTLVHNHQVRAGS